MVEQCPAAELREGRYPHQPGLEIGRGPRAADRAVRAAER